jgi:FixJ family two-component response regulator
MDRAVLELREAGKMEDRPQHAVQRLDGMVLVVDDEPGMRSALTRLFVAAGARVRAFESGQALLADDGLDAADCIVLDLRMPRMSGLQVQESLNARQCRAPTLFLTGAADVPAAVKAMQGGAFDFIEKPFDDEHLLARVHSAIQQGIRARLPAEPRAAEIAEYRRKLALLTPREQQVLAQVVTGQTSKQIARVLGASHRTIEIHRAHLMEKLEAATLADVVRMHILAAVES